MSKSKFGYETYMSNFLTPSSPAIINPIKKLLQNFTRNFKFRYNSTQTNGKHAQTNNYITHSSTLQHHHHHSPICLTMTNKSSDYKRVFNHFDEDNNGMISSLELHRRLGMICGEEILIEDVEFVVESVQSDGELRFDDFYSLVESEEDEKIEDLRKAFRMYETDGSDCITPMSLNRMLSRLGESRSVDECVGMIRQFDLNGDGVLNFDEFKAMML
ncbi:putative serine/threonine-protein phosphatase with EF-hands [Helianthus annuus]|uniref:Putative parvalbumin n=2 Tax=Helianthus annuus TaxID=4232 RepID=A0A251U0Z7_HELAN|nr:putative serine/threonine-protein phosphatase with EF-hands [Helianthus annuus]KAJ0537433.1 putative EF-hand domain-containing protein [Helianthus annuus]KAJ0544962.1 putative EF-hand domain pair protein CML [Helianthus annuus]KAJ0552013.1 putative EF-hand domain-containing protein [Helianthus annuus]